MGGPCEAISAAGAPDDAVVLRAVPPGTIAETAPADARRLEPTGHARLRRALWIPVLGAVRRSDWLRTFYERLRAAGNPAKLALIAAMRKLLHAVYSVAKNRKPMLLATEQARKA